MKGLRLFGLDHLLHVTPANLVAFGNKATGFSLPTSGIEVLNVPASGTGDVCLYLNADKKLAFGLTNTASPKAGIGSIRLGSLFGDRTDVTELTIGFTLKAGFTTGAFNNRTFVGVYPQTPVWNVMQTWSLISHPTAPALLQEGYYEFTFIFTGTTATQRIEVWRDKVLQASLPVGTGYTPANLRNWYLSFGRPDSAFTVPGSQTVGDEVANFSNIYVQWANDVTDGSTRLGPIELKALPAASINAAGWTPSDGSSVLTVLNTPQRHANVRTPNVVSVASMTPLRVKPNVSGLSDNMRVVAVQAVTSSYRDAGQTANLATSWSGNAVDTQQVNQTLTTGIWSTQFDSATELLRTMPDGTTLTKTKLADLELVLTPI